LGEATLQEKSVRVQIRFLLAERFEVAVETDALQSAIGATIGELISAVQGAQDEIAKAASAVDVGKFKPIRAEETDPLKKLASKLNIDVGQLRKMIRVEDEKPFVVCKRNLFGKRGGGNKAALAIIYVYTYGFDKAPTNQEVNDAYQKLDFKPRAFGSGVKRDLIKIHKITEKDDMICIEPRASIEAETIIRDISSKL
jgi:hypothetical protein